jgi:hypothetical protein
MVLFPMQAELDGVVGPGRLPALADRDQLTYTAAVLLEVQRCGNIVPQGVHHMASRYCITLLGKSGGQSPLLKGGEKQLKKGYFHIQKLKRRYNCSYSSLYLPALLPQGI